MPNILTDPNGAYSDLSGIRDLDLNYEYPYGLDLKPGSKYHDWLRDKILQRARISATAMSNNFDSWNKIDEKMTAYIAPDAEEEAVKDDDERKPISIVFPYSYAIMESLLSYMIAAFFQDPLFPIEGVSPEDTIGAIMMEKVIDQQSVRNKVALALHTAFRDQFCYGFGAAAPQWTTVLGRRIQKRSITPGFFTQLFGAEKYEKVVGDEEVLFEGNTLRNIDPYKYLPDPDMPVHEVQKGEFVGWIDETRYINLLEQEQTDGSMFNVKYLSKFNARRSTIYYNDQSKRNERTGRSKTNDVTIKPVDVLYMYVKLIPKEWKLGTSEKPQKWLFAIGSDEVIIQAKPLGLVHNMMPVAVGSPDFDGYSCTPTSRLEIVYGMQEVLDFLFNSHIANVRKVINDTLIVDPYLINMNDLRKPRAGGLVRLRRPVWGRGVSGAYEQLKVTDITRTNIQDAAFLMQNMDKAAATDASMMGSLRQGGPERLTGAEFQGTRTSAMARMERVAKLIGIQFMQDIGYMFASHIQQLMTKEVYVKTTGTWQEVLMKEYGVTGSKMKVDPMDLIIDYDLKIRDGSVPQGDTAGMMQLFQAVTKDPTLMQTFDVVRIFKHIAREGGAKNVEQFVKQPNLGIRTMPDDQVENQVQQGNLIPFQQRGGGV